MIFIPLWQRLMVAAVTVAAITSVVRIDDLTDQPADHVPPEGFAEVVLAAGESILFDPFEPGALGGRGVLVDAHGRIVGGAPLLGPAPAANTTASAPSIATAISDGPTASRSHATGSMPSARRSSPWSGLRIRPRT